MSRISIAAGLAAILSAGILFSAPVRAESVMKECGAEWKTAKEAKTNGTQTWPEFLKDCRVRHASTTATAAPAPAPSPTPTPTMAPKPTPTQMSKTVAAAPTGAGQFASEGEAKGRCPTDAVVWVNLGTHVYHVSGDRYYGKTRKGAYMCEADAKAAGDNASKSRKPKT